MTPEPLEQKNVSLVGYHDLDGRPGFKMATQEVGGRWYLYLGHLWHSGWTVLDVTDPTDPTQVEFVDGPANTWTLQVQVADGLLLTSLERPADGWDEASGPGFDREGSYETGAYVWDVETDPTRPELLGQYEVSGHGTHRNFYDGGDYAYMTADVDGYEGNILTVVDLSDPTAPHEVGRWWCPGQHPDDDDDLSRPSLFDVPGPLEFYFHGPAYVTGDRAHLSYGRLGVVTLDVSDPTEPELESRFDFGNLGSSLGTHSAVPIPDTDYVVVNSESILERDADSLNYTFLVDVPEGSSPRVVSQMPQPRPEAGLPYKNYYEKGGRFGPHNQHHWQGMDCLWKPSDLVFMTYFNAGLRIFDISDPLAPREAGYFVPEDPEERIGSLPTTLVSQFEDVLVDARGYVYCTDKNHGLFVLRPELDFEGYR
ncbi:MAG: LVIVD repeat-containing protein [Halobacteriota archaeon]